MLTIHKLTKTLGGRTLLREAEMSINWGERVALVGPNGAGKSTLFRMILDEDSPDEGVIERDEYSITGYLPQESGAPTDETIIEIAMGITPEMIGILRTMREHEKKGDFSHPDFAKAQDQFNHLNGYQNEPKAKKILAGLGFKAEDFHRHHHQLVERWAIGSGEGGGGKGGVIGSERDHSRVVRVRGLAGEPSERAPR